MGFQLNFNTVSFVLLTASLVLVILSTISAPVSPGFGLGVTSDFTFGIFGYCSSNRTNCSAATYPYNVGNIDANAGWKFATNTRNTLAKIFILCPIAAGINFICWLLIIASHFFSFKMLMFSIVFNILSFVITTVIAVIVILVFVPNVGWAGWILIGAAAANLISLVFLFLTLKFKDASSGYESAADDEAQDLTAFDEKFNDANQFTSPYNKFSNYNPHDTVSSISKDFAYKVGQNNNKALTKIYSGSSVYNSNPQIAKDITVQDKGSTASQNGNFAREGQVSLVNGPNTPVSSNKQIAPNFVPNTVTPTLNDAPSSKVPQLPYPRNSMNNMNNNMNNANPINKSVFEHHPEVEGHKPFTELYDDEGMEQRDADSDLDSDFTSVSQRAPNPNYSATPNNYEPNPNNLQYNQHYTHPANYQQANYQQVNYQPQQDVPQVQPAFQQQQPRFSQSQPTPPQSTNVNQNFNNPQPQFRTSQSYFPQQQNAGPTISDNVLANNPDFSLGMGGAPARRKNNSFIPPAKRNLGNLQASLNNNRSGPYGAI